MKGFFFVSGVAPAVLLYGLRKGFRSPFCDGGQGHFRCLPVLLCAGDVASASASATPGSPQGNLAVTQRLEATGARGIVQQISCGPGRQSAAIVLECSDHGVV